MAENNNCNAEALDIFVNARELAQNFKLSRSGIFNLIKRGNFPEGIKIGRCRRWKLKEIQTWIEKQSKGEMIHE